MAMGIFQQLDWLTTRVKRLCCAVEQIQQSGAGSYKVYTALLTQSGGDGPAGNCSDDPQPLVIGVTYQISLNDGTGDFTNVGAPNNNIGTYFVATGTTPNNWGTPGDVCLDYNTGAPVVTVLENTIGNIYWTYSNVGLYLATLANSFPEDTTAVFNGTQLQISGDWSLMMSFRGNDNEIEVRTIADGSLSDSLLSNTPIEIRVYN